MPGCSKAGPRTVRRLAVGGQTQGGVVHGLCRPEAPRCGNPEELFVDGERLRHVDSLAEVAQDTWFFDYDADRIHIGTDPTGRPSRLA